MKPLPLRSLLTLFALTFVTQCQLTAHSQTLTPTVETVSSEVYVNYKPTCGGDAQNLDLGKLTASLTDAHTFNPGYYLSQGVSAAMIGDLAISDAAKKTCIFDGMNLHFLQVVKSPSGNIQKYHKDPPQFPIIDAPAGTGWDYEHVDKEPQKPIKNHFTQFFDADGLRSKPWYYGGVGEATPKHVVKGQKYRIYDAPGYAPNNGLETFETFLVAESRSSCPDSNSDNCLQPGQILLLADWTWVIQIDPTTGNPVFSLSKIMASNKWDVDLVTTALANGGYGTTFTPVIDKTICCPEPGTYALIFSCVLVAIPLKLRSRFRGMRTSTVD